MFDDKLNAKDKLTNDCNRITNRRILLISFRINDIRNRFFMCFDETKSAYLTNQDDSRYQSIYTKL